MSGSRRPLPSPQRHARQQACGGVRGSRRDRGRAPDAVAATGSSAFASPALQPPPPPRGREFGTGRMGVGAVTRQFNRPGSSDGMCVLQQRRGSDGVCVATADCALQRRHGLSPRRIACLPAAVLCHVHRYGDEVRVSCTLQLQEMLRLVPYRQDDQERSPQSVLASLPPQLPTEDSSARSRCTALRAARMAR